MIRLITFLVACCASFQAEAFYQQSDSIKKLPAKQLSRQRNIDVKHIALDLRFDFHAKQARGTATIILSPLNLASKILLDAGMLKIYSIVLANGTPLKFNYAGGDMDDGLEIMLDRFYKTGEELTLKIDYQTLHENKADPNNIWGSLGKGIRFFEPTSTTPIKRRQIWSMGEPLSNRYWFPGYDGLDDLRTTEFTATVDKKLMVISNGSLLTSKENSDDTGTFTWKADRPYPNYLTSFVVGEYIDVIQNYEGVKLHTYGYPDEKEAVEATIVRLPDMVRFFSEKTGVNYPTPDYAQVMVQDFPFPGLVGQNGSSIISDNMIDDFKTHTDFFYLWDGIEAQSLASQWFGNLITPKDWNHFWLNRSFSHYFDGLYNQYKNGKEEYLLNYLPFDLSVTLGDWNSGYRHPIVTDHFASISDFISDNYAGSRGSLVLRTLHKQLGEENWKKAIQYYVKSNAGKQVSTEDFKIAIEKSTGESMDWFFDQWIYRMGHPVFEVTRSYDSKKKLLTIVLKQKQKLDRNDEYPQVEFFKGSMEIEIDDRIEKIWIEPKAENTFTFPLSQQPKLVHVDFESAWIKEIVFEKTTDELIYQMLNDKDILGKNWAMGELVKIAGKKDATIPDKQKIYEAFRKTILSNSYWRLRFNTLAQLRRLMANDPFTTLDDATSGMLLSVIKSEKSWLRTSALTSLGNSRDARYADLYINYLNDESERVINAAAIALGKTQSPKAYDALVGMAYKPSWKSQSMISALNGLKELKDPRGADLAMKALSDIHSPRWWLATPIWDYPIAAAETLVALGKGKDAYPMIFERFRKSMVDNDYNDIFANVVLITTLADPRGQEAFEMLKVKFKDDANAMVAVSQAESQFAEKIKK
ncbi:MAG: hypothetical protein HOP08_20205 [Cyclobacteriaceae bacterium]|nr:hypothetical protein [Cyclobacteriaceae bacterium]